MELMKNKYLKFNVLDCDKCSIRNTTELNLLPDIPEKFFGPEYVLEYKVADDRLLESISFELFENTNYWDILLVFNDMRSMNELPVNYDIVLIRADKKLDTWKKSGKLLAGALTSDKLVEKYNEILATEVELNEKYRFIKYISADDLSELESALTTLEGSVKINENLIINKEE